MNHRFELALEARLQWAKYIVLSNIPALQEEANYTKCRACSRTAALARFDFEERQAGRFYLALPLIDDIDCLARHYYRYMDFKREDFMREQQAARRRRIHSRARRIKAMIIDKRIQNDAWDLLRLPSPEQLLRTLESGASTKIDGHFLVYDLNDEITWMDNPYGVEGMLGGIPDYKMCREFLSKIAHGGMYGPTPY